METKQPNKLEATPTKPTTETKESIVTLQIKEYENELSEKDENRIRAVQTLLNKNSVQEEIVRARILAKHKAFISDVFVSAVNSGLI